MFAPTYSLFYDSVALNISVPYWLGIPLSDESGAGVSGSGQRPIAAPLIINSITHIATQVAASSEYSIADILV